LNVVSFLARQGVSNDHRLKIDEYCIKPKNSLFVLGTLATNPGIEITAMPKRSDVEDIPLSRLDLHLPARNGGVARNSSASFQRTVVVNTLQNGVPQEVVRLSSNDVPEKAAQMTQQGKIAAALTKAGITSPAAWVAAGVATGPPTGLVYGTSSADGETPTDFETHPAVVLMKGSHQPQFLISWRSQKDILSSLGWQATAMIWGGPAFSLICLYYLLAKFGWL
jgi:hypothetical protein